MSTDEQMPDADNSSDAAGQTSKAPFGNAASPSSDVSAQVASLLSVSQIMYDTKAEHKVKECVADGLSVPMCDVMENDSNYDIASVLAGNSVLPVDSCVSGIDPSNISFSLMTRSGKCKGQNNTVTKRQQFGKRKQRNNGNKKRSRQSTTAGDDQPAVHKNNEL